MFEKITGLFRRQPQAPAPEAGVWYPERPWEDIHAAEAEAAAGAALEARDPDAEIERDLRDDGLWPIPDLGRGNGKGAELNEAEAETALSDGDPWNPANFLRSASSAAEAERPLSADTRAELEAYIGSAPAGLSDDELVAAADEADIREQSAELHRDWLAEMALEGELTPAQREAQEAEQAEADWRTEQEAAEMAEMAENKRILDEIEAENTAEAQAALRGEISERDLSGPGWERYRELAAEAEREREDLEAEQAQIEADAEAAASDQAPERLSPAGPWGEPSGRGRDRQAEAGEDADPWRAQAEAVWRAHHPDAGEDAVIPDDPADWSIVNGYYSWQIDEAASPAPEAGEELEFDPTAPTGDLQYDAAVAHWGGENITWADLGSFPAFEAAEASDHDLYVAMTRGNRSAPGAESQAEIDEPPF